MGVETEGGVFQRFNGIRTLFDAGVLVAVGVRSYRMWCSASIREEITALKSRVEATSEASCDLVLGVHSQKLVLVTQNTIIFSSYQFLKLCYHSH